MKDKRIQRPGVCLVLIAGTILGTGCTPKESGSGPEPSKNSTQIALPPAPGHEQPKPVAANAKADSSQNVTLQLTKPDLEVVDLKPTPGSDGLLSSVTGTVRNNTDRTYTNVEVEIGFSDPVGGQTGSTKVNCNFLDPHGQYDFKLSTLAPGTTRVEVKGVTGD